MKANLFVVILLLFIFGCTSQQSDQLTLQQKEQIKKEVKVACDSIMARFQRMDVEGALQYYSPDFVCYGGSDGEPGNFQGYKKYCIDNFIYATAYKWTSYRLDFIAITKDTVVFTWDGKNEIFMKSGDKVTVDPSHYTFAIAKIADQWKLFYHHFSGTFLTQNSDIK